MVKCFYRCPTEICSWPSFFLIYINDLYRAVSKSCVFLFAHDTNQFCETAIFNKDQLDLTNISYWLCSNKLTLNADKTTLISCNRSASSSSYQLDNCKAQKRLTTPQQLKTEERKDSEQSPFMLQKHSFREHRFVKWWVAVNWLEERVYPFWSFRVQEGISFTAKKLIWGKVLLWVNLCTSSTKCQMACR